MAGRTCDQWWEQATDQLRRELCLLAGVNVKYASRSWDRLDEETQKALVRAYESV